jgi:type II secretory pathway predicted ATPase ExeA
LFLDYYQLREQPFGVTPDPHFLYLGLRYREALASLIYGMKNNRGFMALIAPPGMGKTSLLFHILKHLSGHARTVYLFQTQCDSRELLRYILHDLGLQPADDIVSMHEQLNEVLLHQARVGEPLLLILDEAQNLTAPVLETVRLLTDFETTRQKLVQVILAGQPQLAETLSSPAMEQLRQRISITARLAPLTREEVARYVDHRLAIAGYQGAPIFTLDALDLIAQASGGLPRNVNTLCFNALSIGFALRQKTINREIIGEAIADQQFNFQPTANILETNTSLQIQPGFLQPAVSSPRRSRVPFSVAAGLMIIAFSFYMAFQGKVSRAIYQPSVTNALAAETLKETPRSLAQNATVQPAASSATWQEVIVQPQDDLMQISRRHFGKFDKNVFQQIQAMNPELVDANQIRVGQHIRIPVTLAKTSQLNVADHLVAPDR